MATSRARRARRAADPAVRARADAHDREYRNMRLTIYAATDPDEDALLRAAAELGIELPGMTLAESQAEARAMIAEAKELFS